MVCFGNSVFVTIFDYLTLTNENVFKLFHFFVYIFGYDHNIDSFIYQCNKKMLKITKKLKKMDI